MNFESSVGGDVSLSSMMVVMACDESHRRSGLHKWARREGRARTGKCHSGYLDYLAGRDPCLAKETREGLGFYLAHPCLSDAWRATCEVKHTCNIERAHRHEMCAWLEAAQAM